MKYETTRMGTIEVDEGDILRFPDGLYGFEQEKEFALMPLDAKIDSPMEWLQSLQSPGLAFVVTDPFHYMPDFNLILTDEEKRQIEVQPGHTLSTRVIVTIPEDYVDMTANLVAPLVINLDRKMAKQYVLATTEYDTRHHLFPAEMRQSKVKVLD